MSRCLVAVLCLFVVADFVVAQQRTPQYIVVGARFIEHIISSEDDEEISEFKLAKIDLLPDNKKGLPMVRKSVQEFAKARNLDKEIYAYDQEEIDIGQGNEYIFYRLADEDGGVFFLKIHMLHKRSPPTITEVEVLTQKAATERKHGFKVPLSE